MTRLILAFAALAAAACSGGKPAEGDGANTAATVRDAQVTASQGSAAQLPSLESDLYCARFAAGAGAPAIEQSCKAQEAAARKEAMAMTVPATILSYCTKTAEATGGSYQVFKMCVERERANADTP